MRDSHWREPRQRSVFVAVTCRALAMQLALFVAGALAGGCGTSDGQRTQTTQQSVVTGPEIYNAVSYDVSPPLRSIRPSHRGEHHSHPAKPTPRKFHKHAGEDPVLQVATPGAGTSSATLAPTSVANFDGVGNGFTGPSGTFTVNSAPPDPDGDVGPNHYFQIVNSDIAIFSKTGTVLYGPVPTSTIWSGFGGLCQADNDGDGVVVYDAIANRWIVTQFAVTNPNPSYYQCVAVSQTGDPTGAYYRYSFAYPNFPDYPKLGVWPDAYYLTFNMFQGGTTFVGPKVCALDRASMLQGLAATQQCFDISSAYGGVLPADLDGTRQPPSGAPNHMLALGSTTGSLAYWDFHTSWSSPATSSLTGPTTLSTATFSELCGGGTCIPQAGTSTQLDSLADRLMYRLAYRNFGDHEAMVANHSVTANGGGGVRWYEVRLSAGTPSLYQQGTYAPDSSYRFMGSAALDQSGNMAIGFSVSGSGLHPGVHYTGRLASDALGTMTQGETSLIDGAGSQTGNLTRWGDYSALAVDPSDGCTFWYTNQYIPSNGSFNWKSRIGAFKLPGCGGVVTNDFSMSATPSSVSALQGASATTTISTATTTGTAQTVSLSASGLPAGTTASFNPASVSSGNSSTMTINVGSSTAPGSYQLTVTGTGTSATHTTPVGLTVQQSGGGGSVITNGGFESGDLTGWTSSGSTSVGGSAHSGTYAAVVGSTSPTNGDSSIAQTFTVPSTGGVLSFWYLVHCPDTVTYDWATATLRDNTSGTTTTLLARTCTNTGAWSQVSYDLSGSAGHGVTLTLISHDDNYPGDPTYTQYDDVVVSPKIVVANPVQNGGFETGSLSPWSSAGTASITSSAHSGSFAARLGSTSPTNGDSSVSQSFSIPTGATRLVIWYNIHCPDSLTYDWATASIRDNTAGTTTTILPKTCSNSGAWASASVSVSNMVGHNVTVTLVSHDDNYPGDATYTWYDDISVQ